MLLDRVVNIGRRLGNHIVIDDPRVSRSHAQIRALRGRYVLFDLNSTGGTFINGQRIKQHSLKPGDVISLAGYTIIYGEDSSPADDGDTRAFPTQGMGNKSRLETLP
jgi:pSer/pThr/pTyr-binding forkhead associated (FHA) protein